MASEASTIGFTTESIVADMHDAIGQQLAGLPPGETANVAFVLPSPDAPSVSYGIEALVQGQSPGLNGEVWLPGHDGEYRLVTDPDELRHVQRKGLYTPGKDEATLGLIQELNWRKDRDLDGAVPLTVTDKIAQTLSRELDLDGVTVNPLHAPATPVGMVVTAERLLHDNHQIPSIGALPASEVVVLGGGGVAGPLVRQVLPDRGIKIPPGNHYPSQEHLDAGAERLATDPSVRLGFTATRRAAHIRELTPDTILVDVGYATDPATGKPSGNAHPELLAQSGQKGRVTAFRRGNGPVTISVIYNRAADSKLARTDSEAMLASAD